MGVREASKAQTTALPGLGLSLPSSGKAQSQKARSERRQGLSLVLPAALLLSVLLAVFITMARISFDRFTGAEGEQVSWSLENWIRLISEHAYLHSLLLTARLTAVTTLAAVLLAYPLALFVRMAGSPRLRIAISLALLIPLLSSLVLQIVGWMVIFSPRGPLSAVLPFRLAFTESSVVIVLVHHAVPFAFFAIDAALRNVPISLEEAAATLGASRRTVLRRILVPLTLSGILSGSLLVAAITFSSFVIPILVGGYRVSTLGVLVQGSLDQSNWPMSATISSALTVVALAILIAYQRGLRRLTLPAATGPGGQL